MKDLKFLVLMYGFLLCNSFQVHLVMNYLSSVEWHKRIVSYNLHHVNQPGNFSRGHEKVHFQIPCEMQRSLDLLRPDFTKERDKREQGHNFGVWRHSVRAHSGGFLQTCAYCSTRINEVVTMY